MFRLINAHECTLESIIAQRLQLDWKLRACPLVNNIRLYVVCLILTKLTTCAFKGDYVLELFLGWARRLPGGFELFSPLASYLPYRQENGIDLSWSADGQLSLKQRGEIGKTASPLR